MSTSGSHILFSIYHSPIKRTMFFGKQLILGLGKRKYKMCLEYLLLSKLSTLQSNGRCSGRHRNESERALKDLNS